MRVRDLREHRHCGKPAALRQRTQAHRGARAARERRGREQACRGRRCRDCRCGGERERGESKPVLRVRMRLRVRMLWLGGGRPLGRAGRTTRPRVRLLVLLSGDELGGDVLAEMAHELVEHVHAACAQAVIVQLALSALLALSVVVRIRKIRVTVVRVAVVRVAVS